MWNNSIYTDRFFVIADHGGIKMEKNATAQYTMKSNMETLMQEVLDILEADDGKSFEEKKKVAVSYLREIMEPPLSETVDNLAAADIEGAQIKDHFWSFGKIVCADCGIVLREEEECDRGGYLGLQREYSVARSMLKEESYCNIVWNEHRGNEMLALSIVKDGNYIGYCGINDVTQKTWEIVIELQPEWTNKGIGRHAMVAMLDAVKERLGVTEYKVRIDPGNYASQKLFEKIGAIPNRIAELYLHDARTIERCEEENLHLIDEALISVAEKFSVEPRKLLSHVLEYTLIWK